jgi:hypothetical protein
MTACLMAVLCTAAAVCAQEPIEWSPGRRLTKADFQGRAPGGTLNAALSWINIDASWECDRASLVASVRAAFDPSRSWWRSTRGRMELDAQLLEHEQLHFDLAEVVARQIRKRLDEFKNACVEPGGTEPIHDMVSRADQELQEEQQRYDRETSHGMNARAQEQWKRRIKALLH